MFNMKMILQEHAKVTKQIKEMGKEIQVLTAEVLDLKDAVEKLEKAAENK
jgi:cell division protein FtsB